MLRSKPFQELLQIILIAGGFAAAVAAYRAQFPDNYGFLTSDEVVLGYVTSVVTFWVIVKLLEVSSTSEQTLPLLIDEFCMGTGLNLLVDAVLNYFQILTRSLYLIVVGGVFVVVLLGLARLLLPPRRETVRRGTLLLGCDRLMKQLARALGQPIVGMVGSPDACPPDVEFLGGESELAAIVARYSPKHILASKEWRSRVDATALLAQRQQGIGVLETVGLYERLLRRIYCRGGAQPMDLLLTGTLAANNRMLAIQAVYTNLIGLFLLLVLSPLLALAAVAVALFSGPGPVIDTTECCGFHNIPFRMMRFRTTRTDGTGTETRIGKLLRRLHLSRLPQLFNIVRGEMALFGPRPVRLVFTRRLTEMIPFYSMRHFVKPGMIGWASVQMPPQVERVSELTEIEYDLYYIKQGSPLLDLEILARTLFPPRSTGTVPADFTVPAQ